MHGPVRIVLDPTGVALVAGVLAVALAVLVAALLRRRYLDSLAEQAAAYHDALQRGVDAGASPEELAAAYDGLAFAYNVCRLLPFSRAVARRYPAMVAPYGISALRETLASAEIRETPAERQSLQPERVSPAAGDYPPMRVSGQGLGAGSASGDFDPDPAGWPGPAAPWHPEWQAPPAQL